MSDEPLKKIADLIPEFLFDLLARIIPGFTFLSLIYFIVYLDSRLSAEPVSPVTSVYQFLAVMTASYVAGFITEILSFEVIHVSIQIHNPVTYVVFPHDTKNSRFRRLFAIYRLLVVYKMFGDPFDENVRTSYIEAVKNVLNLHVDLSNSGDVCRVVSDFIKNNASDLYLTLLKIHAEAMMFKNLAAVCILSLIIELGYHKIANPTFLLVLIIVSAISYIGFVNLNSLLYKRTYATFLALAANKTSASVPA